MVEQRKECERGLEILFNRVQNYYNQLLNFDPSKPSKASRKPVEEVKYTSDVPSEPKPPLNPPDHLSEDSGKEGKPFEVDDTLES